MGDNWDTGYAIEILPKLFDGLIVIIQATLFGIVIAMILGLFFAMGRRSTPRPISMAIGFVVEFIRSTPLLIQLFFVFYLAPGYGISLPAFQLGALALGIHYATYTSEVYRAGIDSVPQGQWEASTALNLNPVQTWTRIVLPQAIPVVIPALGNYLIAMFKDAPLLSFITVVELLGEARIESSRTFRSLEAYTLVGVLFLAVSIPSSILVRLLEKRLVHRNA